MADGRTIAYMDAVRGLTVMSATGKDVRHLVPTLPLNPRTVAWGADNQTIYFRAGGSGQSSFWSVPVSGGAPTHLVQFDDAHNFARVEFDTDGKDFFFTMTERESEIWVMQLRR